MDNKVPLNKTKKKTVRWGNQVVGHLVDYGAKNLENLMEGVNETKYDLYL